MLSENNTIYYKHETNSTFDIVGKSFAAFSGLFFPTKPFVLMFAFRRLKFIRFKMVKQSFRVCNQNLSQATF